jgi:hypothetical protein
MNINVSLRNFFLTLSTINFDEVFYNAHTGKNILFKDVFPPGNYAIVGNSPILTEGNNGTAINEADYVVRFNNFQIQQFEHSVGTKTDIWITGGGVQSPNGLPTVQLQRKILVVNQAKEFKDKQLKIIEKYSVENLSSFIIFHNDNLLSKVSSLIQGVPTTGFLILLLLATKYKNINTYGFSFGRHNNKYHYYKDNVIQDYGHKWSKELGIFKMLIAKKLLQNSDISKTNNNSNPEINFYDKNMPRHVKRLYTQRTSTQLTRRILNNPPIQRTYRNTQNFQKSIVQNPTYPVTHSPATVSYNNSVNSTGIIEDTNNKLIELNKLLQ